MIKAGDASYGCLSRGKPIARVDDLRTGTNRSAAICCQRYGDALNKLNLHERATRRQLAWSMLPNAVNIQMKNSSPMRSCMPALLRMAGSPVSLKHLHTLREVLRGR